MAVNIHAKKNDQLIGIKHQSGLMMVEVLISILIFSIGILGTVALQTQAIQQSSDAKNRNIASSLANDLVAYMWLSKSADPNNATLATHITKWQTQVKNSQLPNASSTVVQTNQITKITIRYKAPSKKNTDNENQYVTQITI